MFCIVFIGVFDSKVVNDETELQVLVTVAPESWSVAAWSVSMGIEMLLEAFVRNEASLWQAVHSFAYFEVHKAIWGYEFIQFVLDDDFNGNESVRDAGILESFEDVVEVEIFEVKASPLSIGIRYGAVGHDLSGEHVGCRGADISWIFDEIAAHGEPCAVLFFFLGSLVADKFDAGSFSAFRNLIGVDGEHRLGADWHAFTDTVHQAAELVRPTEVPISFGERIRDEVCVFEAQPCCRVNDCVCLKHEQLLVDHLLH